jgi:hypothetical protein
LERWQPEAGRRRVGIPPPSDLPVVRHPAECRCGRAPAGYADPVTPTRTTDGPTWATSAARAGYGAALLLAPERLLSIAARPPIPTAAISVARVLGARHLVQAVVTVAAPTSRVVGAGAVFDALHGGSQVGLAALSPRWRGVALADAALATLLVAAAWGSARAGSRRQRARTLPPGRR